MEKRSEGKSKKGIETTKQTQKAGETGEGKTSGISRGAPKARRETSGTDRGD